MKSRGEGRPTKEMQLVTSGTVTQIVLEIPDNPVGFLQRAPLGKIDDDLEFVFIVKGKHLQGNLPQTGQSHAADQAGDDEHHQPES